MSYTVLNLIIQTICLYLSFIKGASTILGAALQTVISMMLKQKEKFGKESRPISNLQECFML